MTRKEARKKYGDDSNGYVSCSRCPVIGKDICDLLIGEIPGKRANGFDDCWKHIAKVMTEREKESETMTREEKRAAIQKRCDGTACGKCKLHPITGDAERCYSGNANIDRNYDILFGESTAPTEPTEPTSDVEHPAHYAAGKYECIEVMREVYGDDAVKHFCLLNAFKYIWRCGKKHESPDKDLNKAIWYLNKYLATKEENA